MAATIEKCIVVCAPMDGILGALGSRVADEARSERAALVARRSVPAQAVFGDDDQRVRLGTVSGAGIGELHVSPSWHGHVVALEIPVDEHSISPLQYGPPLRQTAPMTVTRHRR